MAEESEDTAVVPYGGTAITNVETIFSLKRELGQWLRSGVIFEVSDPEQAKIADAAGACCVVVSAPYSGSGVHRMAEPSLITEVKNVISIPVIVKVRIGHFVEAQIAEALGAHYLDESELLTPADDENFINKHNFTSPFICGCSDLGEALRRVREGAVVVRTRQDASKPNQLLDTVRIARSVNRSVRVLVNMDEDEVFTFAKKIGAPYDVLVQTKELGKLPVMHFAAGGIVTPADAALMIQLGCDGIYVGPEVFDCADKVERARAIVRAVRNFNNPHILAQASSSFADAMESLNIDN